MRLLLVAPEPSADLLASRVLSVLSSKVSNLAVHGVGGPLCEPFFQGGRSIVPSSDLSVMGFRDVLCQAPRLAQHAITLVRSAHDLVPDAALFVDGKGLSSRIAPWLPRDTLRFQYVAPSIWAWKTSAHAAKRFASKFDHVFALFPFEERAWREIGVGEDLVSIAGPPIADELAATGQQDCPSSPHAASVRSLYVFLGSRVGEVARHGPVVSGALARLATSLHPEVQILTAVGAPSTTDLVNRFAADWRRSTGRPVRVMYGARAGRDALLQYRLHGTENNAVGIVASGTAALEAGVAGLPCVIYYGAVGRWTAAFARRKARVQYVGLPNLLADAPIAPELVFESCTSENIAREIDALIQSPQKRNAMRTSLLQACSLKNLVPSSGVNAMPSYRSPADTVSDKIIHMLHRYEQI